MDKYAISKLFEAEKSAISNTDEKILSLEIFKKNYEILKDKLLSLPNCLTYDVMVPFGKKAFMPGQLIHTNEVMVLLGDNWLVKRSAKQAAEIVDRRIEDLNEKISAFQKQKDLLTSRMDVVTDLKSLSEDKDGIVEIKEDFDEVKEREWKEKHKENVRKYKQQERERLEKERLNLVPQVMQNKILSDAQFLAVEEHGESAFLVPSALEENPTESNNLLHEMPVNFPNKMADIITGSTKQHAIVNDALLNESFPSKHTNKINCNSAEKKSVRWEDEQKDNSNSSGDTSDDGDVSTPRLSVIKFRHSTQAVATEAKQPSSLVNINDICSPGDIWQLHIQRPKSILKSNILSAVDESNPLSSKNDDVIKQSTTLLPSSHVLSEQTLPRLNQTQKKLIASNESAFTGSIVEKVSQMAITPLNNEETVNSSSLQFTDEKRQTSGVFVLPCSTDSKDVTITDNNEQPKKVSRFKSARVHK